MEKGILIGIETVAREVEQPNIGLVDNVARDIDKGYIGVGNVARECFSSVPTVPTGATTVIVYDAYGNLRGKLTTTDSEPKLYWECSDSGEIRLTGAENPDAADWYEYQGKIDISIAATPPAGLSVANDHNLTSEGDLIYDYSGLAATLTAGQTYIYYVYSNDDLSSELTCEDCGNTAYSCPTCGDIYCTTGWCRNFCGDAEYLNGGCHCSIYCHDHPN